MTVVHSDLPRERVDLPRVNLTLPLAGLVSLLLWVGIFKLAALAF